MRSHSKIRVLNASNRLFFFISILLLFCTACYENVEGCLDIKANNFDVTADAACSDCCNFPTLELNILHRISDAQLDTFYNFQLNDSLTLDSINYFIVNNLEFYISELQLLRSDGTVVGVEEEIELFNTSSVDTISNIVEDNFALVSRRNPRTNTIGTIVTDGNFTGIRFNLGLSETANTTDPNLVPTNHPLYFGGGNMYFNSDSGYVFNRIEFFEDKLLIDTIVTDTTLVKIGLSKNLFTIKLDSPFSLPKGFNISITLRIDYREWFKLIDFNNDSPSDMVTKITEGLPNSFYLYSIQTSVD